jgi:cyclophilin family peptidyl-prolyl cis-trans isomerase
MSIQLETTFGDIVIDLDIHGSPALCKNILKLCAARYYTNTLIYNIVPGKYCQLGDPRGDGSGGCSIFGLLDAYATTQTAATNAIDVTKSQRRFLRSTGRLCHNF